MPARHATDNVIRAERQRLEPIMVLLCSHTRPVLLSRKAAPPKSAKTVKREALDMFLSQLVVLLVLELETIAPAWALSAIRIALSLVSCFRPARLCRLY